jgi:hypothetical protein
MLPVMGRKPVPPPKGMPPYLVVKLKRGWRYAESRRVCVSSKGQETSLYEGLPQGSRIVPVVPHAARADPKSLSKDERDLARYMHVILPKGSVASQYLGTLRDRPCVEDAHLPPEISLPE